MSVAELREPGAARRARAARHGVADEHALAGVVAHAGGLVAEARGVRAEDEVAVAQRLEVGRARGRGLDGHEHLALGLGDLLDAQVAGAVQHRGPHDGGSAGGGSSCRVYGSAGRTTPRLDDHLQRLAAALQAERAAGLLERQPVGHEREHVDPRRRR